VKPIDGGFPSPPPNELTAEGSNGQDGHQSGKGSVLPLVLAFVAGGVLVGACCFIRNKRQQRSQNQPSAVIESDADDVELRENVQSHPTAVNNDRASSTMVVDGQRVQVPFSQIV